MDFTDIRINISYIHLVEVNILTASTLVAIFNNSLCLVQAKKVSYTNKILCLTFCQDNWPMECFSNNHTLIAATDEIASCIYFFMDSLNTA